MTSSSRKNSVEKAVGFFVLWFLVGGALTFWTMSLIFLVSMGGGTLSAVEGFALKVGKIALPFILPFGGIPAAIQIMYDRPWKKVALVMFAICFTLWLFLMIVLKGP